MSQNKEIFEKKYWSKNAQNDVLNNMQPYFCLVKSPLKDEKGSAPKIFFYRYLENGK